VLFGFRTEDDVEQPVGLPVDTPASSSPVGSLTMPRAATAAAFWSNCDRKLILPPT
jgi:hypothetical protein